MQNAAGLINEVMGTITDILYKEKPEYTSLPAVILVLFDSIIGNIEGIPVVLIVPIRRKTGSCFRLQFPLSLAWATAHKSKKEFAVGLSFVAIFRVRSLDYILFKHFSFNRLERIKNCKKLKERIAEEAIKIFSFLVFIF
ncbi:unnamed protein product [Rhizophagus irregularis]|nr:unnamed protein product [Rhizophagus irregularis]